MPVKRLENDEALNEQLRHHSEVEMWECVFLFFFFGGLWSRSHFGVQLKHLLLTQLWIMGGWWDSVTPILFPHTHTHTNKQTQTRGFPIAGGRASCYSRLSLICLAVWPLVSTACKALIDHSLFAGFGPQGHPHRGHGVVHLTPLVM